MISLDTSISTDHDFQQLVHLEMAQKHKSTTFAASKTTAISSGKDYCEAKR